MLKYLKDLNKVEAINAIASANQICTRINSLCSLSEEYHRYKDGWVVYQDEWKIISDSDMYDHLKEQGDLELSAAFNKKTKNKIFIEIGEWGSFGPMEDPVQILEFESWGFHIEHGLEIEALDVLKEHGIEFRCWQDIGLGVCELAGQTHDFYIDSIDCGDSLKTFLSHPLYIKEN